MWCSSILQCSVLGRYTIIRTWHTFENRNTTTNMDISDNNPNIIVLAMIFYSEGGDFFLKNEVIHHLEKDVKRTQPAFGMAFVWKGHQVFKDTEWCTYTCNTLNFGGPTPASNKMYFKNISICLFDEVLVKKDCLAQPVFRTEVDQSGGCSVVCSLSTTSDISLQGAWWQQLHHGFDNGGYGLYETSMWRRIFHLQRQSTIIPNCGQDQQTNYWWGGWGGIVCMHWKWENCSSTWQGIFQGTS